MTHASAVTDLVTSPPHIRLDTDASRLCAVMKIWVGYVHSILEMLNTVFPPAHSAYGMELMIATYISHSELTGRCHCSSHFKRPVGWPLPTKKEGPYQVARIGLHDKLEIIVLQVDRRIETNQDSIHAQNKCNKADKPCWKIVQHGLSTVTGWSSATKTLGQDTMIKPTSITFSIVEQLYQIIGSLWWYMWWSTSKKNQWCRTTVDTTTVQSYPHSCQIMGMLAFFVQASEQRSS